MEKEKETSRLRLDFNLKKYIRLCLKSWRLFAAFLAGILCIAVLLILHRVPTDEVDASVMLPTETSQGMMSDMARSFALGDFMQSSSSTDNEVDLMRSHRVFLATARQMGLNVTVSERRNPLRWVPTFTKAPLTVTPEQATIPDTLRATLVFKVNRLENGNVDVKVKHKRRLLAEKENAELPLKLSTAYGNFTLAPTEYFKETPYDHFRITYSSYKAAAENYALAVKIYIPNKKTNFINLTFGTPDFRFGERLLKTIIDNYIKVGIENKLANNNRTLAFVNERLSTITDELSNSDSDVARFKEDNRLTQPSLDANAMLERSGRIDEALLATQTEHEVLSLTRDFISDPANNYSIIPGLNLDVAASTPASIAASEIAQYNGLILERMKILNSAKGNNQALRAITEQIDALRQSIITSVNRAYENSQVKLSEVSRENRETTSRIGSFPTIERSLRSMQRLQQVQEQLYLFLLKQREEIAMTEARISPSIVVIDEPHTLALSFPMSNMKILFLAFILGLGIPAAIVFFFRYNASSVTTTDEIAKQVKAPLAGAVDFTEGSDVMGAGGRSAEMIRALRQTTRTLLDDCDGKSLLVTSLHSGEGKTFVASNLAIAYAMLDKRVALVDTNMRSPGVGSFFSMASARGIESLKASEPVPSAVGVPGGNSVDVYACATSQMAPEVLSSKAFGDFMTHLRDSYDYIVIDSAPMTDYADAMAVARFADLSIVVVRRDVTSGHDLEEINHLYEEGMLPRIMIMANGFNDVSSVATSNVALA